MLSDPAGKGGAILLGAFLLERSDNHCRGYTSRQARQLCVSQHGALSSYPQANVLFWDGKIKRKNDICEPGESDRLTRVSTAHLDPRFDCRSEHGMAIWQNRPDESCADHLMQHVQSITTYSDINSKASPARSDQQPTYTGGWGLSLINLRCLFEAFSGTGYSGS